jgi:mycofactocin glycosyltransferase
MGGSPLRLWRITPRAQDVVARWRGGKPVGRGRAAQLLARRLASSGAFLPHPGTPSLSADDVTLVVPVRDRAVGLQRLLASVEGMRCIVVDDASADPARIRAVAEHFGAHYIGLAVNQGPAAARNAGARAATTDLIAFLDSDCVASAGWQAPLLGYFDDPLVAAVAPRVVPAPPSSATTLSRYEAVRSSLDRGTRGGLVRAQSRIPYVPGAALLIRRQVVGEHLFDPGLRAGEDVDLVWRLAAAGWDVRFVPTSLVEHHGPVTGRDFVSRRAFYGMSAAPLSARHPDLMAPLQAPVWSAAAWSLSAARRPTRAAAVVAGSILVLARRLRGLVNDPLSVAARIAGGGTVASALPALSGLTRAWSPALVAALLPRRTRRVALAALLLPALDDWRHSPGDLDLVRYSALHVADDLAYGAGVWAGCLKERTLRPLVPRISLRSRVWSSGSLQAQLGDRDP